jgi:putative ABC transport system substrate-binding protein
MLKARTPAIIYRFAENQPDRLPALLADLISRQVSVIAAMSTRGAIAAKAATTATPIVFIAAEDPVWLGLVASLARPGGNVTGINFLVGELTAKRLELLPVLVGPHNAAGTETTLRDMKPAARTIGLEIQVHHAGTIREIDVAFSDVVRARVDALFVGPSPRFAGRRIHITNLAMRHGIPATYSQREYCEVGGLMSYGTNLAAAWHQAGVYIGGILKGAKPADLPIVQASKFEFVINHQTARTLDLTVPPSLLATADEVIE